MQSPGTVVNYSEGLKPITTILIKSFVKSHRINLPAIETFLVHSGNRQTSDN